MIIMFYYRLVYQLYSHTEEEIAVIEQRFISDILSDVKSGILNDEILH